MQSRTKLHQRANVRNQLLHRPYRPCLLLRLNLTLSWLSQVCFIRSSENWPCQSTSPRFSLSIFALSCQRAAKAVLLALSLSSLPCVSMLRCPFGILLIVVYVEARCTLPTIAPSTTPLRLASPYTLYSLIPPVSICHFLYTYSR